MMAAIKHGLGNLLDFQGRDARQAFWYYVLFVYLVTMVIGMAITIPMTTQAMMTGIEQGMANAGNTDPAASKAAADAAAQAAIADAMRGYMPMVVWSGFATAVILLVGIAASLVRRMHDSGLSGYWALIPLGLQLVNIALIPSQLGRMEDLLVAQFTDPFAAFKFYDGVSGLGAVGGWIAIVLVIAFGVRQSSPGPNRFGDAPFAA